MAAACKTNKACHPFFLFFFFFCFSVFQASCIAGTAFAAVCFLPISIQMNIITMVNAVNIARITNASR